MRIYYSPSFVRAYRKLSEQLKAKFALKEDLFRLTPFHPQLKTHKLHGTRKDSYSFSVTREHRIIFAFDENGDAVLLDIGKHDIYR